MNPNRFIEYCIHLHGIPHKTDCQRVMSEEMWQYVMYVICWSYCIFLESEELGLEEQRNDLQKAQSCNWWLI